MNRIRLLNDCQDVAFAQDEQLLAIQFNFGTGIFGVQHNVALFYIEGNALAFVVAITGAGSQNSAFLGFLFGRFGKDDAERGNILCLDGFDHHAAA